MYVVLMTMTPTQIAQDFLGKANRFDLAERVTTNRSGWPTITNPRVTDKDDLDLFVIPAFLTAHQSVHPEAFLGSAGGILCRTCWTANHPDYPFPEISDRKGWTADPNQCTLFL